MSKVDMCFRGAVKQIYNKGFFYIVGSTFLVKFIAFFGSIFLVRILSKQDFGVLSYYENLLNYFLLFAGIGLSNGVLRYVVKERSDETKLQCLGCAIKVGNIWNFFLFVILLVVVAYYPHPQVFSKNRDILLILGFVLFFNYCSNVGLAFFRAMFDNKCFSIMSFLSVGIILAGRLIGAYIHGIYGTIWMRVASEFICVFFVWIALRKYNFSLKHLGVTCCVKTKEMLMFSFQMMLVNGLWSAFMLNDLYLLGILLKNPVALAEYKVAYVIPMGLAVLVSAIGIFVSPYFTKHEDDKKWIKRNFVKVLLATVGIIGSAAFFCHLTGNFLVKTVFGVKYLGIVGVMNILLVATVLNNGVRQVCANILSAVGYPKYNLIIAIMGMFIQVCAGFLLIPKYGMLGAAYASVIIYCSMAIAELGVVYWKFYMGK